VPSFYSELPEDCLLLGDIVTGFRAVLPQLHNPSSDDGLAELGITVTRPEYFAVTTPCCSVGNQQISLAPLVQIRPTWLTNPYLEEDPTRINVQGPAERFVPPDSWRRMTPEQKQAKIEAGSVYGFVECFVYAPHDLLRVYDVKGAKGGRKSAHWLLEFGSAFRVNCDKIGRNGAAPAGIKILQLSPQARQQLREKIKEYFGRIPAEDQTALATL
jgi:hypothetical protein